MADKEKKSLLQRAGQKIVDWAMDGGSTEDNLKMSGGAGDDISQSAAPLNENKEEPKKEESLLAKQFGKKKERTWNDVKQKNNNDPVKIAEDLNNDPEYKAGELTKKGMEEFGYTQGEDGKWAPKPKTETPAATTSTTETNDEGSTTDTTSSATTDDTISRLEEIMAENEKLKEQIEALQNPDGSVNKDKAKSAWDEHMQKGLEIGAVTLDKDGNYVLTNVNKKGWEDWATILSAGAAVIGLAMGVPIIPINFRKITGKDEKDEAIREFQKQLTDISAGNLAKVEDVESSKEAGDYIKENQGSIDAFTNYVDKTASYKSKSTIDADKETKLINERLKAEQALVESEFRNKLTEIKLSHEQQKDLQKLLSDLSTDSAKELLNQERYGYLIDMAKAMQKEGMDEKAIALKIQSLAGNTATAQNINHAKNIASIIIDAAKAASGFVPGNGSSGK